MNIFDILEADDLMAAAGDNPALTIPLDPPTPPSHVEWEDIL